MDHLLFAPLSIGTKNSELHVGRTTLCFVQISCEKLFHGHAAELMMKVVFAGQSGHQVKRPDKISAREAAVNKQQFQ